MYIVDVVEAGTTYNLSGCFFSLSLPFPFTRNRTSMDASSNLPSTPRFTDLLISELIECQAASRATRDVAAVKHSLNLLSNLTGEQLAKAKSLMLTLHCLFPNDLLPALDILDRKLVRRLVPHKDDATTETAGQKNQPSHPKEGSVPSDSMPDSSRTDGIFLVMSASTVPQPGASSTTTTTTHVHEKGYEVRLDAWNCTCPTFALSAFRDLQTRTSLPAELPLNADVAWDQNEPRRYPFGGTLPCATDRASPPVCKHILASVLFARCYPQLGTYEEGLHIVSTKELAGWCAGWGG